jgi:ribosomal protein L31
MQPDIHTMWNESATRARECTAYPAINSTKKKAVSMPKRIIIRVDLESPMVAVSQRE